MAFLMCMPTKLRPCAASRALMPGWCATGTLNMPVETPFEDLEVRSLLSRSNTYGRLYSASWRGAPVAVKVRAGACSCAFAWLCKLHHGACDTNGSIAGKPGGPTLFVNAGWPQREHAALRAWLRLGCSACLLCADLYSQCALVCQSMHVCPAVCPVSNAAFDA